MKQRQEEHVLGQLSARQVTTLLQDERSEFVGGNFVSLYTVAQTRNERQAKIIHRLETSRRSQRREIQRLRSKLMQLVLTMGTITKQKLAWTTEPVEVYDPARQEPLAYTLLSDLGYKTPIEVERFKRSLAHLNERINRR